MNYFRRTLPSLDALVFFEAAARLKNFTHAAAELHVSQVAVSKRIRALEEDLGVSLFQRFGRSVTLTAEGHALAERARAGLSFLEEAVTSARRGPRRHRQVIQMAANENMNFFWLAPLVRDFQMSGNEAVISVVTANNVSDVVRAETDLAIFHGTSPPEGWDTDVLFDEIIAPVAAPAYWQALKAKPGSEACLLDYRKEAPEWVNWESLRAGEGRDWFAKTSRRVCSSYIQSISFAREGMGVGLGVLPMLAGEIAAGELISPDITPIQTGHRYFVGTPAGRSVSVDTASLVKVLLSAGQAWRQQDGCCGA